MTTTDTYRAARALADMGHAQSAFIPHADIDMAAALAGVPCPQAIADRAVICGALDALAHPTQATP